MSLLAAGLGIAGAEALTGAVNTGYNIFANERNYQFSRDQFEYQKYLNQNSAQIRTRDLIAAGLSPTMAAGAPSVSAPPIHSGAGSVPSSSFRLSDSVLRSAELDLQKASVSSQVRLNDASADAKSAEADSIRRAADRADIDVGFRKNTDTRAQELHPGALSLQQEGLSNARLRNEELDYQIHNMLPLQYRGLILQNTQTELRNANISMDTYKKSLEAVAIDIDNKWRSLEHQYAAELSRAGITQANLKNAISRQTVNWIKGSNLSPDSKLRATEDWLRSVFPALDNNPTLLRVLTGVADGAHSVFQKTAPSSSVHMSVPFLK